MKVRLGKNYTTVNVRTKKNFDPDSVLAVFPAGTVIEDVSDDGGDWLRFNCYIWKSAAETITESKPTIAYVSQIGSGAVVANDCGQACSSMIIGGSMTPDEISDVFLANQSWFDGKGVWTKGRYTTFNQHVQFLKSKGFNARKEYFKDSYPPIGSICLINYSKLPAEHSYDKNFQKSSEPWHFVVFMGIGEEGVFINDPLWKNKDGEGRIYSLETWKRVFTGSCVVTQ